MRSLKEGTETTPTATGGEGNAEAIQEDLLDHEAGILAIRIGDKVREVETVTVKVAVEELPRGAEVVKGALVEAVTNKVVAAIVHKEEAMDAVFKVEVNTEIDHGAAVRKSWHHYHS